MPRNGAATRLSILDAAQMLVMNQGSPIRALGSGYITEAPDLEGKRLTIQFEVDEASPHAWLSTRAFLAERPAGSSTLRIAQVV